MLDKNTEDNPLGGGFLCNSVDTSHLHTIYMPTEIDHEMDLDEICAALRSFSSKDAVVMYLANFGGSCHAGQRIINAMADCRAPITVIVDAPCYSMGALIAISGDALLMHQGTFLMFHNYSSMAYGKGGELIEQVKQHDEWLRGQQFTTCYPFLSRGEIKKLEKDQDIYIPWNDKTLLVRMGRHSKYQLRNRRRIVLEV